MQRWWTDIKTSLSQKHEAVNGKYGDQDIINLDEVKIPNFELAKMEIWYQKINGLLINENEDMQVD